MMKNGNGDVYEMKPDVKEFVAYLQNDKKASQNTIVSYQRDLLQLVDYLEANGITEAGKVTKTSLNSYILHLEKSGKATTTISRILASVKAFFHYELREGKIRKDPAELLKTPKIEKKPPVILTEAEVENFLEQPKGQTPKEIRDKAMLELLYATGIRVSELIALKIDDVNMGVGFIICRDGSKERMIPFGRIARQALQVYLSEAREFLQKGHPSDALFTNCSGKAMSRQGFWKIVKYYGEKAGIQADITPHTLRHSFAAHLIRGGADIQSVQTMLGHADMATTQVYTTYLKQGDLLKSYSVAHPRH